MMHAGMGHDHVESFLTTVGVPVMVNRSMKKREREASAAAEHVANKSCDQALIEEIEMTTR